VSPSRSDSPLAALPEALSLSSYTVRFVFLDLLWKFLWLLFVALSVTVVSLWAIGTAASVRFEGPDLDPANPIIWIAAMRELWMIYGTTMVAAGLLVALSAAAGWFILEALFRGGWKHFWLYFASGTARFAVLVSAIFVLGWPALQARDAGLAFLALVIFSGLWCLVTMVETAIRRNAVDTFALNLLSLAATVGFLQFIQVMTSIILWGSAVLFIRAVTTSAQAVIAVFLLCFLAFLSTALHSYLLAARFSAVDIMRRSSVDG
jgi:hypothetical protein